LLLMTGCVLVAVLGLGAVEADALILDGETFTSNKVMGSTLTGTCTEPRAGAGSFNFSVRGTATGPFPGTFTESGSFTSTGPIGLLSAFSSTFTVTDAAGRVTVSGSGSLPAGPNEDMLACDQSPPQGDGLVSMPRIGTIYQLSTQEGVGQAGLTIIGVLGSAPIFSERFGSNSVVHQQCVHGGWISFGALFKNPGDCVSFFATGGKNPPGGS
jgi:hypothetical protein